MPGLSGGTSQRHGTKKGGHWQPARHVPLEYAARHGSVRERPRASPSCSAQTKPQFRFHPPGLHPQPGQRDKASSSDSHGWRTKASGIPTRCPCIRGALPASLRAPRLQPRSAGAQGRGGRRGLMVLRGMGTAPTIRSPRSSPAHAALLPTEQPQGPLRAAGVGWPLGTARLGTLLPSSR